MAILNGLSEGSRVRPERSLEQGDVLFKERARQELTKGREVNVLSFSYFRLDVLRWMCQLPGRRRIRYKNQWINKGLMLAVLSPMWLYSYDFNHIARRGSTFQCSYSRASFILRIRSSLRWGFVCRQLLLRGSNVDSLGFCCHPFNPVCFDERGWLIELSFK